jgi:hypothetical protein
VSSKDFIGIGEKTPAINLPGLNNPAFYCPSQKTKPVETIHRLFSQYTHEPTKRLLIDKRNQ